jgi:hypothetical protein
MLLLQDSENKQERGEMNALEGAVRAARKMGVLLHCAPSSIKGMSQLS